MAHYAVGKDHGVEKVRGNVNNKKRKGKKSRTTIVKRKKLPISSLKKRLEGNRPKYE